MTSLVENDYSAFAEILAGDFEDVLEELQAIDLIDLVSFIRFGQYAAIDDLLQSSTELFFRDGTFTFAWNAWVDMAWGDIPTVTLGMEFKNLTATVFFNLSLRALESVIQVVGVLFDPESRSFSERRRRLIEALADAHLPRRDVRRPRRQLEAKAANRRLGRP